MSEQHLNNPELDALEQETAAADAPAVEQPAPGAAPVVSPAAEWAQLPALFGSLITPAMPELKEIYTDAVCLKWGEAMVPVADRYGWNVAKLLGIFGPWLMLAMATHAFATPTVLAIRARMQAAKQAEEPKPDAPAADPPAP